MAMIKLSSESPASGSDFTFDRDDAVTPLVGPSEHAILAHGTFITHSSEYFKTALKKEWAEGQTRTITLVDECPQVVSHYLRYTYTAKLPIAASESPSHSILNYKSNEHYELLAELYVLGERLLDESIRVAVIKEIVRLSNMTDKGGRKRPLPKQEAVNIIYRGTTTGSPARRLMVDIFQTFGERDWLDSACEPDLLLDVAQRFYEVFEKNPKQNFVRFLDLEEGRYLS